MLASLVLNVLVSYWPLVLISSVVTYLLRNKFRHGLNKYPGPPLAAYTDWWRFFDALGRKPEQTHIKLHRQYGDVVRMGPNIVSFADPRAIKIIYGLNKGFVKSEFYPVQQGIAKGRRLPSLFSTTDEHFHAQYRRCVNSAFAMSSLISYEPLVNSTTSYFLRRTQEVFADSGQVCDFTHWLQFYAFDVVGELTWSKRLGFLEKNEDVGGIVDFLGQFLSYVGPVGQMPFLDLLLVKNPIKMLSQRLGISKTVFPATAFAIKQNSERSAEMDRIRETGKAAPNPLTGGIDLLSKFTQAQHDHPEFMNDEIILTSTLSMIFAGSDTTAISLSSIFYHLITNPDKHKKLMDELDDAVKEGRAGTENGIVTWQESQKLPYLDAVIQESLRMHPAPGLIMERIVPKQGIEILGERIAGGTIVGCNAWVIHRRPEVFGEDCDHFRPERWLEASPEQLKMMKSSMFQFGAGARTCIGKNISLLEMYKMVPSFLLKFDIEREGNEPWKTHNQWFVKQKDFMVRFRLRDSKSVY